VVRTGGDEDATDMAFRVKRDVLGRGFVGAMATGQQKSGDFSGAGGLDFNLPWIINGQNFVVLGNTAWNQTAAGAWSNHSRLMLDYPNDHADIVVRFDRVGEGFEPALGFVQQSGIHRFSGQAAITPRPRRWGIRRFDFNLGSWDWVTRLNGDLDNASLEVRPLGAQFESGDSFEFNLQRRWDVPPEAFEIFPGSTITAGRYAWNRVEIGYEGSRRRAVVPEVSFSMGDFYDGTARELSASVSMRREPHVLLRAEYSRSAISRGAQGFTASTVRLRTDYAFSPRLNVTGFAQYDNESERVTFNLRTRWTRSPGSDLYLVWNSLWPSSLESGIPWRRPSRGALVVKYIQYLRW
jgi:hypothetical protein